MIAIVNGYTYGLFQDVLEELETQLNFTTLLYKNKKGAIHKRRHARHQSGGGGFPNYRRLHFLRNKKDFKKT